MNSSREILRSVSGVITALIVMLIAIVMLGLHVERSIGNEPRIFPVSIPWNETPDRSALPVACGVGS